MSLPFLLEIGAEEIPDWMIVPALDHLGQRLNAVFQNNALGGGVSWTDGTPRRLTVRADGLAGSQPDETKLVSGPPVASGAGAANGFARKAGLTVEQLQTVETAKGAYYAYQQHIPGRTAIDILSGALPEIIGNIPFPKSMYWTGKGGPRFIRPVRWIVALFGDQVVPFSFAAVHSGNLTLGHRILSGGAFEVTIDTYEENLRQHHVLVRAQERQTRIEAGLASDVQPDSELLKTLVYLTEYPTPIRGGFSPEFLQLPREILSTVMRHHQRYFSVLGQGDQLAPQFVAVMNIDSDGAGLIRKGNERVLKARFNDARFFWDIDMKRPLSGRLQDLKSVTFQAKLGSYFEKTERMLALGTEWAEVTGSEPGAVARAIELSKCDLTTEMVKEFTELQGIVGGLYARANGEPESIWRAVYDHYKPASMEEELPSTREGMLVSLADKADTLRGCFSIGLIPTGSSDPFALRRAAQGSIRILVEADLPLTLDQIAGEDSKLREFLLDRLEYYFRDVRGLPYDEVNAVLAAGVTVPADAWRRLNAIHSVRQTPDFEPLAASFKRTANILKQANEEVRDAVLDSTLLQPGPEEELHSAFLRIRNAVAQYRERGEYQAALEQIASLRPKVDRFFDTVLVNAPEPNVRRNRLLLLSSLLSEFSTIAVFSEIVPTQS